MSIILSIAKKSDLSDCEKLAKIRELKLTTGEYPNQEVFRLFLKQKLFIVAKENKKIIGFICGEPMAVSDGAAVWFLTVDKNYQGKGIGSLLLARFEKECKKIGKNWLILYAPSYNKKTLAFYKKHNFNLGQKLIECFKQIP